MRVVLVPFLSTNSATSMQEYRPCDPRSLFPHTGPRRFVLRPVHSHLVVKGAQGEGPPWRCTAACGWVYFPLAAEPHVRLRQRLSLHLFSCSLRCCPVAPRRPAISIREQVGTGYVDFHDDAVRLVPWHRPPGRQLRRARDLAAFGR